MGTDSCIETINKVEEQEAFLRHTCNRKQKKMHSPSCDHSDIFTTPQILSAISQYKNYLQVQALTPKDGTENGILNRLLLGIFLTYSACKLGQLFENSESSKQFLRMILMLQRVAKHAQKDKEINT